MGGGGWVVVGGVGGRPFRPSVDAGRMRARGDSSGREEGIRLREEGGQNRQRLPTRRGPRGVTSREDASQIASGCLEGRALPQKTRDLPPTVHRAEGDAIANLVLEDGIDVRPAAPLIYHPSARHLMYLVDIEIRQRNAKIEPVRWARMPGSGDFGSRHTGEHAQTYDRGIPTDASHSRHSTSDWSRRKTVLPSGEANLAWAPQMNATGRGRPSHSPLPDSRRCCGAPMHFARGRIPACAEERRRYSNRRQAPKYHKANHL